MQSHKQCRPPKGTLPLHSEFHGSTKLWRLDPLTGRWGADNSKPGLAFVGVLPDDGSPIIWIANCRCPAYAGCPLGKALDFANDKLDLAAVSIQRRVPVSAAKSLRKR